MDQEEIYNYYMREKLEKYGAAKLYFASRWNIVIIEPELLLQLFKNENIYAKSGNQEKIPYSVLAPVSYTHLDVYKRQLVQVGSVEVERWFRYIYGLCWS